MHPRHRHPSRTSRPPVGRGPVWRALLRTIASALRRAWLALPLAAFLIPAHATLRETQLDVPVSVQDMQGRRVAQTIRVTVFDDDANPHPAPVLVLNHGRAVDAAGRAALGRARYHEASRFFVRNGFIVAVPTRVGYGVSGGPDVEDSGACQRRDYPAGYGAAADQALAALAAVRAMPGADPARAVIVGQSYGGATAIAAAARATPGVVGAINFAGGGGGNPRTHAGQPCSPQQMGELFASYGRSVRIPTLWLYAENDQYFGADWPRQWFSAFRAAGGNGELVQFPPQGEDGHSTFTRAPQAWQPVVSGFLQRLGFPALRD